MDQPVAGLPQRDSYQAYLDLPDDLRAEYVNGVIVMTPPPTFAHQRICLRLRDLLVRALPAGCVTVGAGWRLKSEKTDARIPDVCVLEHEPEGDLITTPPLVAVEVLSSNRTDDLVRKSTEYLDAGAVQYWIVDPRDRVLDAFLNTSNGWELLAHLTDEHPSATVEVPPLGRVSLDLAALLT